MEFSKRARCLAPIDWEGGRSVRQSKVSDTYRLGRCLTRFRFGDPEVSVAFTNLNR